MPIPPRLPEGEVEGAVEAEEDLKPQKYTGKRDSVITMSFDKFGGGPYPRDDDGQSTFSDREKIDLACAVRGAAACSSVMQKYSKGNFLGHLKQLKLWFGIDPLDPDFDSTLRIVVNGVNKIHAVLSDNEKMIQFVDMREQTLVVDKEFSYVQVFNQFKKGEGGERAEFTKIVREYIGPECGAFVHLVSDCVGPGDSVHEGSILRIYIGEFMFNCFSTPTLKSRVIYHELTHKMLNTKDYDSDKTPIYGEEKSLALALKNRYDALKHADCWSFFFNSFAI